MKLRKLMFVLPNLFTVSSIFCGFYALTLCSGEAMPVQLYQAALAIFFGIFFDGFDGRVARLTRTQSAFGMELDSLADAISFGVAPALLVYKWALQPLGFVGIFISFAFAACGALRLARFNVLAQRAPHGGGGRFFVGLPIPIAAAMIVSLVITHHATTGGTLASWAIVPVAAVTASLSLLMVSTIRYRTFKDLRLSKKSASVLAAMIVAGVLVATRLHPAYVLLVYAALYLAFGLIESGVLLRNHLVRTKVDASSGVAVLASESEPGSELESEAEDDETDVDEEADDGGAAP